MPADGATGVPLLRNLAGLEGFGAMISSNRLRAGLLATAAATALLATQAIAQDAPPATTHHHAVHRAIHRAVSSMDAKIDALESEIHELRAEQNRESQRTSEVQARVASSPAAQPQV